MIFDYTLKFSNTPDWAKCAFEHIKEQLILQWVEKYQSKDNTPRTIFIAWAPWSWKTEFLETVIDYEDYIVIDIDKYRLFFDWYNGSNSSKYQDSCSRVATFICKFCIKNKLNFIFDWTLSGTAWMRTLSKCYKKNRKIVVILLYQAPSISYTATLLRNVDNKRQVSIETFMRIYYNSITCCFRSIQKYPEIWFIVSLQKQRIENIKPVLTYHHLKNLTKYIRLNMIKKI